MTKPPNLSVEGFSAESRALLAIALPLTGTYITETVMPLGNTMIVGRLGTDALAGVGLASNLLLYLLVVGIDIVGISSVLMAESVGSGDGEKLSITVSQSLWLATVLSIPATILCWELPEILGVLKEPREIIGPVRLYLHSAAWCILPTLWMAVIRSFAAAIGKTRPIMVVSAVSVGVNLALCYVLVFGAMGIPPQGVLGAGLARSATGILTLIVMVVYVHRSEEMGSYRPFRGLLRQRLDGWFQILRLGLPAAGFTLIENGLFSAVGVLVGFVGASALAASQIGLAAIEFGVMIAFAIGDAATVRIGLWAGRNDPDGMRRSGRTALLLGSVAMLLVGVALWANARRIVGLFINPAQAENYETVALAIQYLGIAAIFQVFDGLQVIGTRALWGLKDTITPVWVAVIGFWLVGIGNGCVFAFLFKLGGVGLWWGLATGLATTSVLVVWRFEIQARTLTWRCEKPGLTRLDGDSAHPAIG
jgi:MATE family multidrug resistance protein